jgi:hypothetical protein
MVNGKIDGGILSGFGGEEERGTLRLRSGREKKEGRSEMLGFTREVLKLR